MDTQNGGVKTPGNVKSTISTPTTGMYPKAPVPDMNPGQVAGSGMAGAGNKVPSGVPANEGCLDGGCKSF